MKIFDGSWHDNWTGHLKVFLNAMKIFGLDIILPIENYSKSNNLGYRIKKFLSVLSW